MKQKFSSKTKTTFLLVMGFLFFIIVFIGAAYAYFQAQVGAGTNTDINITTGTTDNLTFALDDMNITEAKITGEDGSVLNKGIDDNNDDVTININANMANFNQQGNHQGDGVSATVMLKANNTYYETEEYTYNVYILINQNELQYSSYNKDGAEPKIYLSDNEKKAALSKNELDEYKPIPELYLSIKGPDGIVTSDVSINDQALTYYEDAITMGEEKIGGFDITEANGLIKVKVGQKIQVTGGSKENDTTTHNWEIKVYFKNLDTDQNLNTGKNLSGKVIIQKENYANYSVYSWQNTPFTINNIDNTIKRLQQLNITEVYHAFKDEELTSGEAVRIVQKLQTNHINTYLLDGDPTWYNKLEKFKNSIDLVANYNLAHPEATIKGIVMDTEPHALADFANDKIGVFEIYIDTFAEAYTYAKEKNIELVNVIPYWYDTSLVDDNSLTKEEDEQRVKNAFNKMIANCDKLSIMNYYKKSMTNNIEGEMLSAQANNKKIESIAEFQRPEAGSIEESISMWIEKDPLNKVNEYWDDINEKYNYENLGFSYHTLETILELFGDYNSLKIDTIQDAASTTTNMLVYLVFADGDIITVDSGHSKAIPQKEYKIYLDGKNITNTEESKLDYDIVYKKLTFTDKKAYDLEIYPRYINPEVDKGYKSIKEGTITLQNAVTGQIKTSREISDSYTTLSNIYEDTEYIVTINTTNGDVYKINYIDASDDNHTDQKISNDKNNLLIPLNFMTSNYLVPKMYFDKLN